MYWEVNCLWIQSKFVPNDHMIFIQKNIKICLLKDLDSSPNTRLLFIHHIWAIYSINLPSRFQYPQHEFHPFNEKISRKTMGSEIFGMVFPYFFFGSWSFFFGPWVVFVPYVLFRCHCAPGGRLLRGAVCEAPPPHFGGTCG